MSTDPTATVPATLESALTTLTTEFEALTPATVTEVLMSSYDQLAQQSKVHTFLPLLTERFTRQRLQALTRIEQHAKADVPAVLFLCVHNAGRSQMALGWFTHLAGDNAIAWSGGSEPVDQINPSAIAAMAEVGIDITEQYPKPWTNEIVMTADVVVTMGCGDACPYYPSTRYIDWELDDPAGQGVDAVRPIRDEIEHRVRNLLAELGVVI